MFVFCLTHNLMLLHLLIHSKLLVFYRHWVSAGFHAQKVIPFMHKFSFPYLLFLVLAHLFGIILLSYV